MIGERIFLMTAYLVHKELAYMIMWEVDIKKRELDTISYEDSTIL
jgi:hypothetical protein